MNAASHAKESLAPGGALRVLINYGNPALASRDANTGKPSGISIDIAKELARCLGVTIEFLTFDATRKSVAALETGQADLGFLPPIPCEAKIYILPRPT